MTRDEQVKQLDELMDRYERLIARGFMAGIKDVQSKISLSDIQKALESGDILAAMNLANEAVVAASFVVFNRELQNAFIAGGDFSARLAATSKIEFGFDITQPSPAGFYRDYKADKVRQITREMQSTITQIISRETLAGQNPNKTARLVRENLGLTAHQEKAVNNYRKYLEGLDSVALQRELRDKRFDPTIRRAIKDDKALSQVQVDKMVSRYREKYIRRRSLNIARTESLSMINAGSDMYWQEAVKSGVIEQNRIRRKWIVTRDSKLRDAHAAIPRMNMMGVGMNEPFKSPLGNIRYPGDPAASSGNRINCRCTIFRRII